MRVSFILSVAMLVACGGGSSGVSNANDVDVVGMDDSGQPRFVGGDTSSLPQGDGSWKEDTSQTGRPNLQLPPGDSEVEIIAEDGTRIWGRFLVPGGLSPYPAVILVHQYGMDHSQWMPWAGAGEAASPEPSDAGSSADISDTGGEEDSAESVDATSDIMGDVIDPGDAIGAGEEESPESDGAAVLETLLERGFAVLAIDLRGHGNSDPYPEGFALLVDPEGTPQDVAAAISWLKTQQPVDPDRIAIMGASIGANLAYLAMAQRLVRAGVAISARAQSVASLFGLSDLSGVEFGPVFCIAGELDSSGAQKKTCAELSEVTEEPNPVNILEGAPDHGLALFVNHPEAWLEVLTFLEDATKR